MNYSKIQGEIDRIQDLEDSGCIESSCMYAADGVADTMRLMLDVVKAANDVDEGEDSLESNHLRKALAALHSHCKET